MAKEEFIVQSYSSKMQNKTYMMIEIRLCSEDYEQAFQAMSKPQFSEFPLRMIPQECMKSLVLIDIPKVISDKDLFAAVNKISPGLKRVIIAENPENEDQTWGIAVATYINYEATRQAYEKLRIENKILNKEVPNTMNE